LLSQGTVDSEHTVGGVLDGDAEAGFKADCQCFEAVLAGVAEDRSYAGVTTEDGEHPGRIAEGEVHGINRHDDVHVGCCDAGGEAAIRNRFEQLVGGSLVQVDLGDPNLAQVLYCSFQFIEAHVKLAAKDVGAVN